MSVGAAIGLILALGFLFATAATVDVIESLFAFIADRLNDAAAVNTH